MASEAGEVGHTPGPWTHNAMPGHFFEVVAADGPVLRIRGGMMPTLGDRRLIAAAPELLEALRPFVNRLDRWLTRGIAAGPKGLDADLSDIHEAARAAIAKAEGREGQG